jgi:uncharacterized short protein YbdD (DUF466 family)
MRAMIPSAYSRWLRQQWRAAWCFLRETSGDAAYENYLTVARRQRAHSPASRVLSAEEFYLDKLRRRYTGVSRCC